MKNPEFYRHIFNEDQQIFDIESIDFSDKQWYENMKNYIPESGWIVLFDFISMEDLICFDAIVSEKKYKERLEIPYVRRLALWFKTKPGDHNQTVILPRP